MRISYVILTHNRREVLLGALRQLPRVTGLPPDAWEAIVVDNGSTDGTPEAVKASCPWVQVVRLDTNQGSPGRNAGARLARGEWLVFLDDDSWPRPGAVRRGLEFGKEHPGVAVLGGPVRLPDGGQDGSALPLVPPGCGLMIRRSMFEEVGGFCPVMFQRAEEYDLVFRVVGAGYGVHRLEALAFDHEKTPVSRQPVRILSWDLQNNLLLASRYLPSRLRARLRGDWLRRYVALLRSAGGEALVGPAIREARRLLARERGRPSRVLDDTAVELLFGFERTARGLSRWAQCLGIKKIIVADHSKTIRVVWEACHKAGLEVVVVCDDHPAYRGMKYPGPGRSAPGVDIVPDARAVEMAGRGEADGVVLSNMNPAHVGRRAADLRAKFQVPVLTLWPEVERVSTTGVGGGPAAASGVAGNGIGS